MNQNVEQVVDQFLTQTHASQDSNQVTSSCDNVSLETLLTATVKFKQYRAIDFARLSNYNYISQLKPSNLNLSLFAYGSIKHLLLLSNGTLPAVSKDEFNSRLQHLLNVLDITCLVSSLNEFDSFSWKIAKCYDEKILSDLEQGYKRWSTLDKCIDSTAWNYAQRMVPAESKPTKNQRNQNSNQTNQKMCTTYNTFRRGESCAFEFNNPNENCVYLHQCSACNKRGFPNRRHKAFNCRDEARLNNNQNVTYATPPVVTTSV